MGPCKTYKPGKDRKTRSTKLRPLSSYSMTRIKITGLEKLHRSGKVTSRRYESDLSANFGFSGTLFLCKKSIHSFHIVVVNENS